MTVILSVIVVLILFLIWSTVDFKKTKAFVMEEKTPEPKSLKSLEASSKEATFALALGDLEYRRLEASLGEMDLLTYLTERWEIEEGKNAKEQSIYALQKLWSQGSIDVLLRNTQMQERVSVKDMIAFDSSAYAELIRQLVLLGILSEEETWGLLFLNAQRIQESFASWDDYQEAYFKGAACWLSIQQERLYDELYQELSQEKIERVWLDELVFSQLEIVE